MVVKHECDPSMDLLSEYVIRSRYEMRLWTGPASNYRSLISDLIPECFWMKSYKGLVKSIPRLLILMTILWGPVSI